MSVVTETTEPRAASDPFVLRAAARVPAWIDALVVVALCLSTAAISSGVWHDFDVPLAHGGDATFYPYIIKTVIEHGWYTQNPDVGAPFGATMYDFPIPEPAHLALIRVLGLFSNNPFVVFNLFYL